MKGIFFMKSAASRLRIWYMAVGVATLLCTALHTVALFTSFDPHPGYFRTAPLTVLLYVAVGVALLICSSLPLLTEKDRLPAAAPAPRPGRRFPDSTAKPKSCWPLWKRNSMRTAKRKRSLSPNFPAV